MLNLFYDSEEVYSYENQEELQKAIDFDQIGQVQLDQNNQSITYKINRRKCIRLRDLIFWIESEFIRIHLGQLLHLIFNLVQKVQQMEAQGIEHNYLDLNRIWLQLKENSQYPCLIYQSLNYSIHFTGYQCPFYEKENYTLQVQASQKLKEIIQIIINRCFNSIQLKWTNTQKRNEIFQEIVQPIIQLCKQNSSFYEIIALIQDKLKKYANQDDKNNKLMQSLTIDDNCNDQMGSERQQVIPQVNKDLIKIIGFGEQYGQIVIEFLLQYSIPIISKHLESYSKIKLDYFIKANEQYLIFQKRESNLRLKINKLVKIELKSSLQEYEKSFKFEITQQEIDQLEKEIVDSIIQSKYVKYFDNTYWLYSNNSQIFEDKIEALISKDINEPTQDKLKLLFMYKILQLIDDLI